MSWFRKKVSHSLGDLIKGLYHAVNSAQQMLAVQQIKAVEKFFSSDGSPLTRSFTTPAGKRIDVPLVTVVPHTSLCMDEVEIRFSAVMDELTDEKLAGMTLGGDLEFADFRVSVTARRPWFGSVMRVKVKFKAAQPPEGLARIVDENIAALAARTGDQ